MNTIISTHPVSIMYCKWRTDETAHIKECLWDFTLPGGAGISNKKTLVTPEGVATEVSDEVLSNLMEIEAFTKDVERGFVKVLKNKRAGSVDADKEASKDMNTEGSGKQITSEELEKDGAVINDDGSIDLTKGGKGAALAHASAGAESKNSSKKGGKKASSRKK